MFYDEYGRAIQVRSNNHLNSAVDNLTTNVYLYDGTLTQTKTYHKTTTNTTTVLNTYAYDTQGRLVTVKQKNNTDAEQTVALYTYNELGQLVDKKLHNTGGANYLQSVDYRYTIRGQLKSINNSQLTADASNDDTDDYFGMELLYNELESGLGNNPLYNGNISAIKWKGSGSGSGTLNQKSYTYSYDKSGKLEEAAYAMKGASTWNVEAGAQNETMTYDHNGNIKTLKRKDRKHQLSGITVSHSAELIDDLTYTYNSNNGNSLDKVTDAALTTGFDNGTSGTNNDYSYDVNGNVTADLNKGISSVVYNEFGKAKQINFSDGRVINYTFDAAGAKLKMIVTQSGIPTTTDYVGGFVYENGSLSFFSSPEGRVVKNGATLEYQYAIADHQGNTRVVFTSAASTAQVVTANMEATTNSNFDNYPTGAKRSSLNLFDHTDAGTTYTYSNYLNGGYNGQVGVAKSYKVYPGDKVKIDAFGKYQNPTSASSNVAGFASALFAAFGVAAPVGGESGTISSALNVWGGLVSAGNGGTNPDGPIKAFVNIIVFDKNYKLLDASWDGMSSAANQVGVTPVVAHDFMSSEYTIKEEGYVFMYVSNENPTLVDVYFDDVTMTYTPGNVIQYNEYYPFGLQTSNSWTRTNTSNNYLYNAGNELNKNSGLYEMFYRGYDPALGRMMQVDPYAPMYASHSTYNYALNNPVMMNDPSGGQVDATGYSSSQLRSLYRNSQWQSQAYSSFDSWSQDNVTGSSLDGSYMSSGVINSLKLLFPSATFSSGGSDGFWIKTWGVNSSGEGSKYGDATMLGELLNRYIFVSNISRDHFNSMTNSISQAIHQGQEAFMDNPFGGGLMAFLSGGGLMGGGAIAGRALSGLNAVSPLVMRGGSAVFNLGKRYVASISARSFATNTVLSISSQFIVKQDASKIDYADAFISGISGRGLAQVGGGLLSGLVDLSFEKGFVNGFNKNGYQLGVDMATGVVTGGLGIGISSLPISNEWINAGGFFNTMIGDGFNSVLTGN